MFLHIKNKWRTAVRMLCRRRLRKIVAESTSIICNNCFGTRLSQELGYAYLSPTVGLFFYYPDYITFVKNLRAYCESPLKFRNESKWGGGGKSYPIGYLEYNGQDVEIEFLHYQSEDEAREKWTRRCMRINWDDLLVVGSEVDGCTKDDVENFITLPYERKYFFTKHKYEDIMSDCLYHVPEMNRKSFTNLYGQAHLLFVRMATNNKLAIWIGGLL